MEGGSTTRSDKRSFGITEYSSCRTRILTGSRCADGRNMSIVCVSPPVSYGVAQPHPATASTWIYGRTILSTPERKTDAERLQALPPLPRDNEGPVFAAPWQTQAFAL